MFRFERFWNRNSVRETCIKFGWYTCGDCTDYNKMMGFVETHKPTDRNIDRVVEDIFNHSDPEDHDIESVAYCFGKYAVSLKPIEK